jgi:hypothetical protein
VWERIYREHTSLADSHVLISVLSAYGSIDIIDFLSDVDELALLQMQAQ